MKRYIVLIIAIPLSVFAIYKLLNNQKKVDEVEAPIAIDIVPVDSEFAKQTRKPLPIDMSKDPIKTAPSEAKLAVIENSFDAINKPSTSVRLNIHMAINPTTPLVINTPIVAMDKAGLKPTRNVLRRVRIPPSSKIMASAK